jgi:stress response protein YsnF
LSSKLKGTIMTTVIIGAYDDQNIATKAVDALRKEGIDEREIRTLSGDGKTLASDLAGYGFGRDDVRAYAEAAEDGKTLVVASVAEEKADEAAAIMDRFETESAEGRSAGKVPVVEEELSVEKSKSASGGVRVTSSVEEQPVEETVRLREETVSAERRAADRPLSEGEADGAFEERTIEMMGTTEDVEVHKEARVVGEVELKKQAKEREATIRDSVRKNAVEVEKVEAPKARRKG